MNSTQLKQQLNDFKNSYKEEFGSECSFEYKMGAQYVYLNTGFIVIHDTVKQGDFKAYFSPNVLSHPILSIHEAFFVKKFFGDEIVTTQAHVVDPFNEQVVTGNNEAIERLMVIRKLEAKALVEQMVNEAATEKLEEPPKIVLPNDGKIIIS